MIIKAFPFTLVTIVLYNVLVLFTGANVNDPILRTGLPSGDVWTMTVGEVLIVLAMALLFLDILSSTRIHATSVINHGLSLVVFVIAFVEFLLVPNFGTSTFFIITLIAFFDVVAGYTITILAARRDVAIQDGSE